MINDDEIMRKLSDLTNEIDGLKKTSTGKFII